MTYFQNRKTGLTFRHTAAVLSLIWSITWSIRALLYTKACVYLQKLEVLKPHKLHCCSWVENNTFLYKDAEFSPFRFEIGVFITDSYVIFVGWEGQNIWRSKHISPSFCFIFSHPLWQSRLGTVYVTPRMFYTECLTNIKAKTWTQVRSLCKTDSEYIM